MFRLDVSLKVMFPRERGLAGCEIALERPIATRLVGVHVRFEVPASIEAYEKREHKQSGTCEESANTYDAGNGGKSASSEDRARLRESFSLSDARRQGRVCPMVP